MTVATSFAAQNNVTETLSTHIIIYTLLFFKRQCTTTVKHKNAKKMAQECLVMAPIRLSIIEAVSGWQLRGVGTGERKQLGHQSVFRPSYPACSKTAVIEALSHLMSQCPPG